jgi:hypothetical protein
MAYKKLTLLSLPFSFTEYTNLLSAKQLNNLDLQCFQKHFKVEITRIYIKIININPLLSPFVYVPYKQISFIVLVAGLH